MRKIVTVTIVLIITALFLCGCSQSNATGTYCLVEKIVAGQQEQINAPAELTLQTDSSFCYIENHKEVKGSYSIDGGNIALSTSDGKIIGEFYNDDLNIVLSYASTVLILQKQSN